MEVHCWLHLSNIFENNNSDSTYIEKAILNSGWFSMRGTCCIRILKTCFLNCISRLPQLHIKASSTAYQGFLNCMSRLPKLHIKASSTAYQGFLNYISSDKLWRILYISSDKLCRILYISSDKLCRILYISSDKLCRILYISSDKLCRILYMSFYSSRF